MDSHADLRRTMVDCQLRTFDITDRAVLAAAEDVPREAFLPGEPAYLAYLDRSVAIAETGRSLATPMVTARMIQSLEVQPGEAALEYAGGTGYGAALLARMGAKATLWELDAAARALAPAALAAAGAETVDVIAEQPALGSFDVILVSGACERQPESLFGLLRDGGRLVAVEGTGRAGRVRLYQKSGDVVAGRPVFDAAAPLLPEFEAIPAFVF